jgi:hypothetical protein
MAVTTLVKQLLFTWSASVEENHVVISDRVFRSIQEKGYHF